MLMPWKCGNKMETNQTLREIFLQSSCTADVLLLFWPHCALLALADSVQSPIVSFTQYCLLASYNLLKEGRNVKQV